MATSEVRSAYLDWSPKEAELVTWIPGIITKSAVELGITFLDKLT